MYPTLYRSIQRALQRHLGDNSSERVGSRITTDQPDTLHILFEKQTVALVSHCLKGCANESIRDRSNNSRGKETKVVLWYHDQTNKERLDARNGEEKGEQSIELDHHYVMMSLGEQRSV